MATDRIRRRMAALVREWETSGDPRRDFARRHGLTVSRFDYWTRQVRRESAVDAPIRFAPVQLVTQPASPDSGVIDVVLAGGERLTIRDGVSLDVLRTVVTALRTSC